MNIQRKRFLYSFGPTESSYYHVLNGSVYPTATLTYLRKDPLEWRSTHLQWKRNSTLHGVFRAFVVPMTFAKDGATILRKIYYTEGVEGVCVFKIWKLNTTTELYELYYQGNIDFSQSIDTLHTFQAAILDSGAAALVQAKRGTVQEIPIMNSDAVPVYMDGITLRGTARYVVPEQGVSSPVGISNTFLIVNSGAEGINEATFDSTMNQTIPPTIDIDHGKIYTAKYAETVTITMHADVFSHWPTSSGISATFNVGILKGIQGGTVTQHFLYTAPAALSPGTNQTYNLRPSFAKITLSLGAGESIAIFALMLNSGGAEVSNINARLQVIGNDGAIDIYTEYQRPATVVPWYRQIQVLQKVVAAMSGGLYTAVSDYLNTPNLENVNNKPYNTLLTGTDALRGLGDGSGSVGAIPPKLKLSLDDLHKDSSCRDMTGIGVEGDTIRLEPLTYFYDNSTVILDLGAVNKLQISAAPDSIWNTLKIGYNYRENEKLNGRDDPFLSHQYASPGIRVKKEEDKVSTFIASPVSQEYIRANLGGQKTTDSNFDNDVCLCEIGTTMSGGAFLLRRDQNLTGNSIAGMLAGATAYNLSLTPKRNLYRNAPLIHAALHLLEENTLSFQTADQNAELVTKLNNTIGAVIEKADVPISTLAAPLFLPIIFEFETPVPNTTFADITANPYGKIRFSYNGIQREMFILEVSIKPADNATCIWKGYAAPNTDLSTLIR